MGLQHCATALFCAGSGCLSWDAAVREFAGLLVRVSVIWELHVKGFILGWHKRYEQKLRYLLLFVIAVEC